MPKNLSLTLRAWPVITIVTIGLCLCTELVASWFGIRLGEQQTVLIMREMGFETWELICHDGLGVILSNEVAKYFTINILLAVIVMPIFEELIFRGLLFKVPCYYPAPRTQTGEPKIKRYLVFLILSSALFSAAHYIQSPESNNAFVALFFFALAQCWLYRQTQAIWCVMLNHALFNLTNLVLLFALPTA